MDHMKVRVAATKVYLSQIVEDELDKYDKGEWLCLVRARNRQINPEAEMAD